MGLRAILVLGICNLAVSMVSGNAYFRVESKFKGGKRILKELKDNDVRRHGRFLAALDVPIGGNWQPSDDGLYYTRIGLGNPPKEYHVQLDTGSQVLWVNSVSCEICPKESGLGIKLNFYDPNSSTTAKQLSCSDKKCAMMYRSGVPRCKPHLRCEYEVSYGDGSLTSGYFVEDSIHFEKVSGDQQATTGNGSVVFGCAGNQDGELTASDAAVDGILGFGQSNSSMLSQLAAAGKVKKMFSHCLDGRKGGGIFAIGELLEPKLNATSPLIPHKPHYYVFLKSIEVYGDVLELSTSIAKNGTEAIVDCGTTLGYLPKHIYEPVIKKIFSKKPDLRMHIVQKQFHCFQYSGKLDDGFPHVVFHFQKTLNLTVYPHDYLFSTGNNDKKWCIGWMRAQGNFAILGDFLFTNKVVFYDIESQSVGWTDHNCSSSIKVKDEESKKVYAVGAHDLSSVNSSDSVPRRILTRP